MPVKQDGRFGLMKPDGTWLVEPKYAIFSDFKHGWAFAGSNYGGGAMVDLSGKSLFSVPCNIEYFTARFVVCDGRRFERKDEIYNRAGKRIRYGFIK